MTETKDKPTTVKPKRPFMLSFLCVIGFTYTSLFSILFLVGMLYSTGISGMFDKYMQIYDFSRLNFLMFSMVGFLIFFAAFTGIFLMWKMQKLGFFIYAVSSITFLGLELIISGIYWPDIIVHSIFILLFLIVFPFGRKRRLRLSLKKQASTIE